MKVWYCGDLVDIEMGQKVFVGCCGSGHTVFGEYGYLVRTTKTQLVFKTESGAEIRTAADNLHKVVGKAGAQGNFISLVVDREFIHSPLYVY